LAKIALERRYQDVPALAVVRPDAGYMGRIARTLHHFRERGLLQPRDATIEQAFGRGHGFRQTRGCDNEAKPKSRT
jgi:hypothetical protein